MMKVKNYFGGCPQCGQDDGFINVGRSHWFFCKAHKTSWCIGSNLFSSWREQSEEEQRRIYDEIGLDEFTEVEPLPCTDPRFGCKMYQPQTPTTPKRADALRTHELERLQNLAFDLIKVCELEKSGIRDGDGHWYGCDPLRELARKIGAFTIPPIDEPERRIVVPAGRSGAAMDQIAEAFGMDKQELQRTGLDETVLKTAAQFVEEQFDPESREAIEELRARYDGRFADAVVIAARYLITGSPIEADLPW